MMIEKCGEPLFNGCAFINIVYVIGNDYLMNVLTGKPEYDLLSVISGNPVPRFINSVMCVYFYSDRW